MGGSRVIWESILRQSNAVQVTNPWEMAQASLAFSMLPERVYKGIAVAGGGGALGVAACDAAESFGMELPQLRADTQAKIMAVLPKPGSSATNPIDVANPAVPPVVLREVLLNAATEEKIDLQILIQLFYVYKSVQRFGNKPLKEVTPYIELANMIKEVEKLTGKPVVLVLPNNMQGQDDLDVEEVRRTARNLFLKKNILSFENLTDALKSIGQVSRYYARGVHGELG
jgi:RNase H-fold protein (predicted Holliday junction resolvase)